MNLKELKALIKLCRETGVTEIETTDIKLKLGEAPPPLLKNKQVTKTTQNVIYAPGGITEDTLIPSDSLTEEQLLFYSALDAATESNQQ